MNINTKFNVDDKVYVMDGGDTVATKPKKIVKIFMEVLSENRVVIKYILDDSYTFPESCLYATLKEAQDAYKDARLEYLRAWYGKYIDEYLALTQDDKKN